MPRNFGELDGETSVGCFIKTQTGYLLAGSSESTLVTGYSYGTPYSIFYDDNFVPTETKLWTASGGLDIHDFETCAWDK